MFGDVASEGIDCLYSGKCFPLSGGSGAYGEVLGLLLVADERCFTRLLWF